MATVFLDDEKYQRRDRYGDTVGNPVPVVHAVLASLVEAREVKVGVRRVYPNIHLHIIEVEIGSALNFALINWERDSVPDEGTPEYTAWLLGA